MDILLLACTTESAFGGELGSINLHIYFPVRKARHSLIKELGLDRVAKITPWKKKLDDRIQTRGSVVCKFTAGVHAPTKSVSVVLIFHVSL
jgi:hypothetical protein